MWPSPISQFQPQIKVNASVRGALIFLALASRACVRCDDDSIIYNTGVPTTTTCSGELRVDGLYGPDTESLCKGFIDDEIIPVLERQAGALFFQTSSSRRQLGLTLNVDSS